MSTCERASDVRDLGRRILMHLQSDSPRATEFPRQTILVGDEVSAVQLAEVPSNCLVGVVSRPDRIRRMWPSWLARWVCRR